MSDQNRPTKERILNSAGIIFGYKGYKDATIRMIAEDAEVNVAAINYHFRGKEELYGAVLEDVFHTGFTRFPATEPGESKAPPEQQLRTFIRAMFHRLQSRKGWGGMAGQGRLIARELFEPTPPFESILEKYIRPHKELLLRLISQIMQLKTDPKNLMPCAISIIGQCVYYALASTVIEKVRESSGLAEENLDQMADNVWLFSLGGIARLKEELAPRTRPKK